MGAKCVTLCSLLILLLMLMLHLSSLYCSFCHMTCGFSLGSRPRHQKSLLNTGRFILDFVFDSSENYYIITKEKKQPKGPYAITICTTKPLSSKLNLSSTEPYRKALIIKSDVLLNYLRISNSLISCQNQSKMQLKYSK